MSPCLLKGPWNLSALVAEDDPIAQRIVLRMLRGLGLTVDLAENGRQAVEFARLTRYDFILMDFAMPELDGIAATRAIRDLPQGRQPVICALTASVHPGHRGRCLDAGMDDYISKPATLEHLVELMRRWFGSAADGSGVRMSKRLDDVRIQGLRDLAETVGAQAVADVIQMYLDDTPAQLSALREAIEEGDSEQIQLFAHRLRGSSATMGATAVDEACTTLERSSPEDRAACLGRVEVELAGAWAQLEEEIDRMLHAERSTG